MANIGLREFEVDLLPEEHPKVALDGDVHFEFGPVFASLSTRHTRRWLSGTRRPRFSFTVRFPVLTLLPRTRVASELHPRSILRALPAWGDWMGPQRIGSCQENPGASQPREESRPCVGWDVHSGPILAS